MTFSAGARLGPYEILSLVGSGGIGEVYRACDRKLNREVAIKVLPEAFTTDSDRVARFEREAHVLAAESSVHRPHLRLRGRGGYTSTGHGTRGGTNARGSDRAASHTTRRDIDDCKADRGGAGSRARAGHRASRSQAGQHQSPRRRY